MKLPSAEEYQQIINKKTRGDLATLYNHRFILDEDGKTYLNKRSRNHIIFKSEYQSIFFAVRFFLNDDDQLFRRYHQLQDYLTPKSLPWKVPFRFMDEEYYPVILMNWVNSFSLTEYLDLIINNPSLISKLQRELVDLSRQLETNGIGHGNLNMTHVRFTRQNHILKLIDYDSMFIPAFKEKDSFSAGTSGFQHPMRLASDFSETIDRFSIWIFITALEAFKTDASLWINAKENGFDKTQQIFFTYRDIAFANQSVAFEKLRLYNNPAINFYCDKLTTFCNSSLSQVEAPRLYEERNSSSINTNQKQVEQQPVRNNEVFTKQPAKVAEKIAVEKTSLPVQNTTTTIEKKATPGVEIINNGSIYSEQTTQKENHHQPVAQAKRKNKRPIAVLVIVAVLLISSLGYLTWSNQAKKEKNLVAVVPKPSVQIQQPAEKKEVQKTNETIFTSSNINQFLFQLYQSYNKRDLSSILSNYHDNLSQYYDAGAVSKNKLSDVIKNLFIKPVYYECHPDLTTLKFTPLGDSCRLSISIDETIKADKRSKTEDYSSKIEYTVDSSFKILAEKNIE